jgi:hypothetical protein
LTRAGDIWLTADADGPRRPTRLIRPAPSRPDRRDTGGSAQRIRARGKSGADVCPAVASARMEGYLASRSSSRFRYDPVARRRSSRSNGNAGRGDMQLAHPIAYDGWEDPRRFVRWVRRRAQPHDGPTCLRRRSYGARSCDAVEARLMDDRSAVVGGAPPPEPLTRPIAGPGGPRARRRPGFLGLSRFSTPTDRGISRASSRGRSATIWWSSSRC